MYINYNFNANLSRQEAAVEESSRWAKPCDLCRSAPSAVYCHADTAYLCASCDTRVHAANCVASRHERVRVCEACEVLPATLACRADAAALCTSCDAQVHMANPLARRHQRVPILPLPATAVLGSSRIAKKEQNTSVFVEEEEVDSWLLVKTRNDESNRDVDEYLDLAGYNLCYENGRKHEEQIKPPPVHQNCGGNDGIVPSQVVVVELEQSPVLIQEGTMNAAGLSNTTSSLDHHCVSFSSMEAGIVPDTTMTDFSIPHILIPQSLIGPCSVQMAVNIACGDREARVLRYKEKRKARKFQKTIRYASRKAYAEARPRIKGRFARRTDVRQEFDTETPYTHSDTFPWF